MLETRHHRSSGHGTWVKTLIGRKRPRRYRRGVLLLSAILALAVMVGPQRVGATGAEGFRHFLQPGFTQTLYGTDTGFLGGIAIGPNFTVTADNCAFSGSPLHQYSRTSTFMQNGSTLHTETTVASDAGCGITQHPNGSFYTNTGGGVVKLDPTSGALLGGPFGPPGNALGITVDPLTGNLVYVGSGDILYSVDAGLTTSSTFSSALAGHFTDGIAFDPSGQYLFASDRTCFCLAIIKRDGTLVQEVSNTTTDGIHNGTHEPDGIAFNSGGTALNGGGPFVLTNNTDGSISYYTFPGNDFTQPGNVAIFADGGFRGDLTQVGGDNCFYLTQEGTNYADGTSSGQNSIVQICGGKFIPPPGLGGATPELGSGELLVTGLLPVLGTILYRRRRARRATRA